MDKNQIEYLYIDDTNAEVGIVDGDILIKNKDDKVVASLSGKKELIEYNKVIELDNNSYEIANTEFVQAIAENLGAGLLSKNNNWTGSNSFQGLTIYKNFEVATIKKSEGKDWTQSNITTGYFNTVHYGNGVWVAGSYSGNGLYYSLDGKTWIQSNITTGYFVAIHHGNGVWVDGSYSGNGLWVAGSDFDIGLYYSLDSKTWTQSNINTGTFVAVHYGNGLWVTSNNRDGLYYSLDGKTWIQSNITTGYFVAIHYGNGVWVAGSFSGDGLYYSLDGKTWTQSNIQNKFFNTVHYGNGLWVAGSYSNSGLYYSLDGKTWTQSNISTSNFNSVDYGNGLWVAGSYSNSGLYYSEALIGMFYINTVNKLIQSNKFKSLLKEEDIMTINRLNSQFKNMIDNNEQIPLDDIPDNIYHIINEFLLFDDIEFSMSQLVKYTIPFYSSEFSESENEQLIAYLNECRLKLRMFETHELGSGINLQVPEKTNFINMLLTEGFI